MKLTKSYTVELPGNVEPKVPALCSYRWAIAFVVFFGCVFITALRVDLSLAIVCMVKESNKTNQYLTNSTRTASTENLSTVWLTIDDVYNDLDNDTDIGNNGGCSASFGEVSADADIGEFEWDKPLQSEVLSAFFYGYIITQVLGGWLSRKYGCRLILGIGMSVSALATVLFPICARTHIYLVFANRFITGLGTSVSLPAVYALWGRWAPPLERTKLISFSMSGVSLGAIVSNSLSGYLCKYGFDDGWGAIFYVFGGGSILWLIIWFIVVYDSPGDHPRISPAERDYIQNSMGSASSQTDTEHKTPWVAILKSRSIWVVAFAHFCVNWLNLTLATDLPTYMKEVLKYDVKANGLLSSVPYITNIASSITAGILADKVRRSNVLSTTATRRIFTAVAFIGSGAFLVAAGFVDCDWRWEAVLFLALANGFLGLTRGGCMVNHVDFGRRYAGELYGITNTIANAPGMVVPIVNGALTPNGTREEWMHVFVLCAVLCFCGTLVFSSMGRGEPEPWAETPITIEMKNVSGDISRARSQESGTLETPVAMEHEDTNGDIPKARSMENDTLATPAATEQEVTGGNAPEVQFLENVAKDVGAKTAEKGNHEDNQDNNQARKRDSFDNYDYCRQWRIKHMEWALQSIVTDTTVQKHWNHYQRYEVQKLPKKNGYSR